MPYKDKDKQREANRQAAQRKRAKGVTNSNAEGMTENGNVIPEPQADVIPYNILPYEKVYGRQAVIYPGLKEAWATRPIPDDPTDKPIPNNRGMYRKADGGSYLVDACGSTHGRNDNDEVYAGTDYIQAREARIAAQEAKEVVV